MLSKVVGTVVNIIGISSKQGATTPLFLLTSQKAGKLDLRGKFWDMCEWRRTPRWMEDASLRRALWTKWEEDVGVDASDL